jgi:signal transduction histidine kinase
MTTALLDALPGAVLHVGADSHVLWANQQAHTLLGAAGLGIDSRDLLQLLDQVETFERQERASPEHEGPELTVQGPDGLRTWAAQSRPVGDGTTVVVFEDITRMAESRRERSRLLQLASISEVMPAVLHELKNPIAGVVAALELLIEDSAPEVAERLHAVLGEVRRLTSTIDGLGRFGSEVHSSRSAAIDLSIRDVASLLSAQARARRVELVVDVRDMPLLPFEPAAIRAVVTNLITNALFACQAGQKVTVSASYDRETRVFTLAVADTGAGMSPEVRRRCTELFYTTKERGSGIGLPLCASVARAAGGSMDIRSEPGRGTTISLTFPVSPRRP